MALKHIAKYRAMVTGNTVEEELKWLKVKREINLEKMFGVENEFKNNKKSGGEYDERQERF